MVLLRSQRRQAARGHAPAQTEIQTRDAPQMKHAELPTGEVLEFPDNTPDGVIRRTVRNHLGIERADVMSGAMDKLGSKFEEIIKQSDKMLDMQERSVYAMSDAVTQNVSRIAGELSDAIREVQKTVKSLREPLAQMNMVMNTLNRTLDAAMGQSLDAADRGREVVQGGTMSMERHAQLMAQSMERLASMIETVSQMKKTRRTARRNRDGSYTFE
jgi:ABC-type transporter Mla subunit MlaD